MKREWRKKLRAFWLWVRPILLVCILVLIAKSVLADWYRVPTGSMKPTIVEGDRIFVNKLAYDLKVPYTTWRIASWDDPKRGDIVVFYSPADGKSLVKRVIGLPGDSIAMRNNQLFINEEAVKYEPFDQESFNVITAEKNSHRRFLVENLAGRRHPVMITIDRPSLRSFGPVTVPEGRYFMMGDNRDNSADSRYFGFVERNRIVGQATAIVASLDLENYYRPRWERFFTKLP